MIALVISLAFFVNLICSSSCAKDSRTEKIILIGHSVAEIFEVARNQHLWQQLSFFNCFLLSPVANMVANYICMKQKGKVFDRRRYALFLGLCTRVVHIKSLKRTGAFG